MSATTQTVRTAAAGAEHKFGVTATSPSISPAAKSVRYVTDSSYSCFYGTLCARVWDPTRGEYKVLDLYSCNTYYLCPALTSDLLSPARGLLTVSTWSLEQRIVGPLSARVHFLTSALNIADGAARLDTATLPLPVRQLLVRYAQNIPGAHPPTGHPGPPVAPLDLVLLRRAAEDELTLHTASDTTTRTQAAARARSQLGTAELLFGGSFQSARRLRSVP